MYSRVLKVMGQFVLKIFKSYYLTI